MKFIQGHNRTQINLLPVSHDQSIDPDNEVRMIELFSDSTWLSRRVSSTSALVNHIFKETDYTP